MASFVALLVECLFERLEGWKRLGVVPVVVVVVVSTNQPNYFADPLVVDCMSCPRIEPVVA